jgi:hypothetical protein
MRSMKPKMMTIFFRFWLGISTLSSCLVKVGNRIERIEAKIATPISRKNNPLYGR